MVATITIPLHPVPPRINGANTHLYLGRGLSHVQRRLKGLYGIDSYTFNIEFNSNHCIRRPVKVCLCMDDFFSCSPLSGRRRPHFLSNISGGMTENGMFLGAFANWKMISQCIYICAKEAAKPQQAALLQDIVTVYGCTYNSICSTIPNVWSVCRHIKYKSERMCVCRQHPWATFILCLYNTGV